MSGSECPCADLPLFVSASGSGSPATANPRSYKWALVILAILAFNIGFASRYAVGITGDLDVISPWHICAASNGMKRRLAVAEAPAVAVLQHIEALTVQLREQALVVRSMEEASRHSAADVVELQTLAHASETRLLKAEARVAELSQICAELIRDSPHGEAEHAVVRSELSKAVVQVTQYQETASVQEMRIVVAENQLTELRAGQAKILGCLLKHVMAFGVRLATAEGKVAGVADEAAGMDLRLRMAESEVIDLQDDLEVTERVSQGERQPKETSVKPAPIMKDAVSSVAKTGQPGSDHVRDFLETYLIRFIFYSLIVSWVGLLVLWAYMTSRS